MYPVIYLNCDLKTRYNKYNFFSRIKDNMSMRLIGESFIKELGVKVAQVKLPPNFHKQAYMKNIEDAKRFAHARTGILSPKTLRLYDYKVLNAFQRNLIAYGVVKSIQLILRTRNKSIKNSCILICDALNNISLDVLHELAKHAKYIILISDSLEKLTKQSDYVVSNYGITPVVTNDIKYALESADFIITNRDLGISNEVPTWYIDNDCVPNGKNKIIINDVSFKVPWECDFGEMSPELLGGILSQMDEKDIEKSLKYNGIYLDKIKFNENVIQT